MVEALSKELGDLVVNTIPKLHVLGEAVSTARPRPDAWSIKEIVGHLLDSAANNHQRFVRAQERSVLTFPGYEQEHWVRAQDYQTHPWDDLIDLWALYNRHLEHVIRRIPVTALGVSCRIGDDAPVTLGHLLEDYIVHMRHHLQQIEDRATA